MHRHIFALFITNSRFLRNNDNVIGKYNTQVMADRYSEIYEKSLDVIKKGEEYEENYYIRNV